MPWLLMPPQHGKVAAMARLLFITHTRIGDCVLSTGLLRHFLEQQP
ncbi:MAG: glycosyltransferase family 9 protein, partial [Alphaproteobacteria bacterium]|nr:glycosyltransferase family 9 protein [Alphaproteobacteria bacterium]